MKTVRTANTSMPYKPEPTPPKTTSPSWIRTSGTAPPSGMNESCIALTAPHDAAVVIVAKRVDATMPNLDSLPSMLPPGWSGLAAWSTSSDASAGLPRCSIGAATKTMTTKIRVIAASTAQPCRMSPTIRPKQNTKAAGIRKIDSIWTKFERGVGF